MTLLLNVLHRDITLYFSKFVAFGFMAHIPLCHHAHGGCYAFFKSWNKPCIGFFHNLSYLGRYQGLMNGLVSYTFWTIDSMAEKNENKWLWPQMTR